MSSRTFDQVLADAKSLSRDDQERLVKELSRRESKTGPPAKTENGAVRSLYDVLEASGLVGFMTDGPGDLSTNPKHMEGFGRDAE